MRKPKQSQSEKEGMPTRERLRIADGAVERGDLGTYTMRDSPLERALARGVISSEQYNAGQKYRHHWFHAGLAAQLSSMDLNRVFASDVGNFSGMAKTENQAYHRHCYREAVKAIGILGSSALDGIVCNEITLEHFGSSLGWEHKPQAIAVATDRLRTALDVLRKLWGLA